MFQMSHHPVLPVRECLEARKGKYMALSICGLSSRFSFKEEVIPKLGCSLSMNNGLIGSWKLC